MAAWLAFGAALCLLGVGVVALGLRALLTGRNWRGWWSRGFTAADDARLARAPAAYFRALGAVATCLGGLLTDLGGLLILFTLRSGAWAPLAVLFALLLAGLIASLVVLVVLAIRYHLTRFDAP